MLDVRLSDGLDEESLVAFVDRLSAAGDGGKAVDAARARITRDVRAGEPSAGVRRLALSLHTPIPPRPRSSSDEPETVLSLVPDEALIVLSGARDEELVETVAGLVRRGLRTIVTATGADLPDVVRRQLPPAVAARTVERLRPIPGTDLRRLRRLLSTSTPARRARGRQDLPPAEKLPDTEEIAGCCERAARVVEGSDGAEGSRLAELLRDLDAERREAVTQVGRYVGRTVGALNESTHAAWLRPLAARLVHNNHRAEFDGLQVLAARQREAAGQLAPGVTEEGTPPADAATALKDYRSFLETGGRSRTYFRSLAQREAQPALRAFRVNGAVPRTVEDITAVLGYLDVRDRQAEIELACGELGVPVPVQPSHLDELIDALGVAAAAARSVGALRHDVLFLQNDSPVAVPDLPTAERVAAAIVDYDEHGDPAEAGDELERLAAELEAIPSAPERTPPELTAAVEALRAHDADAYAAALDALGSARRESEDQQACEELLGRLATSTPELARAWSDGSDDGYGLLCFASVDSLLSDLPSPDSADVVVVLGAGALQADALLLTAVAPRLVGVVGDEPRAASSGTTFLEVLNQASARFLRGGLAGRDDVPAGPQPAIPVQNGAAES
ncbi:hypothetical protein [Pseudonocardia endophytica]|uniref:Uncharacterized protein n=1 Tax=Pseudonocardia endophytica TaxID=401976 RepID=A0A4R1IBC9_PSEEN|nr:hypothetical protein [Pseudonocardia endophytica]TCK27732.1 hypothetical protein EV378_3610 [Pseudonocardia endophytica]